MRADSELKEKIVKLVKEHVAKKGIKLRFNTKIVDCSRIVLNISGCSIDLVENYKKVQEEALKRYREGTDEYQAIMQNIESCDELNQEFTSLAFNRHFIDHYFSSVAAELLKEIKSIILVDHYDNSDAMRDEFDCAYGWELRIGYTKKGFSVI